MELKELAEKGAFDPDSNSITIHVEVYKKEVRIYEDFETPLSYHAETAEDAGKALKHFLENL